MWSKRDLLIATILTLTCAPSCDESQEPSDDGSWTISGDPARYSFVTDPDSFVVETSPEFSVSRDSLEGDGIAMWEIVHTIPREGTRFPDEVPSKEFIIAPGDSIRVTIRDCPLQKPWQVRVDGDDLALFRKDSIVTSVSTCDRQFVFRVSDGDKGYIALIECLTEGCGVFSWESPALLLSYTVGVVESLWVNIERITWSYEPRPMSELSLHIQGSSNTHRLKIMTYGDGLPSANVIPLDPDDTFAAGKMICFSHVQDVPLRCGTEIGLYGTVGCPKIIALECPAPE